MEYMLIKINGYRKALPMYNIMEIATSSRGQDEGRNFFHYVPMHAEAVLSYVEEDDFEVKEMSALELTKWLKGEQASKEDDEEEENRPFYNPLEGMVKALKPLKKIIKDIEPSDEDLEWQQYKQALKTINNSESIGGVIPQHIKDWLEHQINACWASEEYYKQLGEDDE